jgi:hypothetical protein
MKAKEISKIVELFDQYISRGLCHGIHKCGDGDKQPQRFCVEAAIALSEQGIAPATADARILGDKTDEFGDALYPDEISDHPDCVDGAIADSKIELNDAKWSSEGVRAKALRNIGILQLGTATRKRAQEQFDKYVFKYVNAVLGADYNEINDCAGEVVVEANNRVGPFSRGRRDDRLRIVATAYEYALSKMNTSGYRWLVKNEGYVAPTLPAAKK